MNLETKGNRLSRADAQSVVSVMDTLGRDGRPVTPRALLEASRAGDSPTHHLFEWNDALAAEAHRLTWAAVLIRDVQVVIRRDPRDEPRTVRAFVNISAELGRGYVSTMGVLSRHDQREQLLALALTELRAFKKKYEELHELAEIFEALERAQAA